MAAWCNEQTALALSQLDSKDAFLAAHKNGNAPFPPLASAKLVRKPGDAQQLASASSSIRLQLVQAMDQSLHEAPAKSTFDLLPLARACEDHACGIRPASLSKIRKSAQYALAVEEVAPNGDTVLVPCQKIVALVRSQQKSKAVRLEHGFNLITSGVQDVMGAGSGAAQPTEEFTSTTMCTVENLSQYKLDPPRGAKQHAIITVADVTAEANLAVEAVQHIPTDQVQRVTESFATWTQLAAGLVLGTGDKRTLPWTDLSSPGAKKCRTLGRSPTDPLEVCAGTPRRYTVCGFTGWPVASSPVSLEVHAQFRGVRLRRFTACNIFGCRMRAVQSSQSLAAPCSFGAIMTIEATARR